MNLLMKARSVIAIVRFYIPAQELASERRFPEAKAKLNRYFVFIPLECAYPEVSILMSLVNLRLGDVGSAMGLASSAFDELGGSGWKYKKADSAYLKFYCSNLIRFAAASAQMASIDPKFECLRLEDLDLSSVTRQIKSNFPLRRHGV